jgi:hypothetical protein
LVKSPERFTGEPYGEKAEEVSEIVGVLNKIL